MRIFLYEYTSACHGQARSLRGEGRAMLQAVAEEFGKIPDVETWTLLAETSASSIGNLCRRIGEGQEEDAFRQLAENADLTLVIAPEFDDILVSRCRWVLQAGGRLLGSPPEVITTTADKNSLPRHLRAAGVQAPAVIRIDDHQARIDSYPAVLKPRFGAGSQATFLVRSEDDLEKAIVQAKQEMPGVELILQSFVPGLPASVAFLVGPRTIRPLLPAAQHLSGVGRFRYQGGEVPLPPGLAERAQGLASRAIAAIPGLLGYVGVDVVLGETVDGSQDYVIEINPRLTTSYIGLRQLARTNLAQVLVDLMTGKEPAPLAWRPGKVRFLTDGTTHFI